MPLSLSLSLHWTPLTIYTSSLSGHFQESKSPGGLLNYTQTLGTHNKTSW